MKFVILTVSLLLAQDTYARDCVSQVKNVFAKIIEIQSKTSVSSKDVRVAEITKYEWTISSVLKNANNDFVEYLAVIDNEESCNILTMIEASSEKPKFDFEWKR